MKHESTEPTSLRRGIPGGYPTKPSNFTVGDWIITWHGKLRKIISDDMPDLPYEDIARLATEEENPEFEFHLKNKSDNLNKQNFWEPLKERCGWSVTLFHGWFDVYQKMVGWNELFKQQFERGWELKQPAGIHHLPIEMQIGILITFLNDHHYPPCIEETGMDHILQSIICNFIHMEVDFRNNEIKTSAE